MTGIRELSEIDHAGAQFSAPLYDNAELWTTILVSAAPLGAAEGEQFLNCRPKPAARFCVDAGRWPKERFPRAPSEKADWIERGIRESACFSANKRKRAKKQADFLPPHFPQSVFLREREGAFFGLQRRLPRIIFIVFFSYTVFTANTFGQLGGGCCFTVY